MKNTDFWLELKKQAWVEALCELRSEYAQNVEVLKKLEDIASAEPTMNGGKNATSSN